LPIGAGTESSNVDEVKYQLFVIQVNLR